MFPAVILVQLESYLLQISEALIPLLSSYFGVIIEHTPQYSHLMLFFSYPEPPDYVILWSNYRAYTTLFTLDAFLLVSWAFWLRPHCWQRQAYPLFFFLQWDPGITSQLPFCSWFISQTPWCIWSLPSLISANRRELYATRSSSQVVPLHFAFSWDCANPHYINKGWNKPEYLGLEGIIMVQNYWV